MEWGLDSTAQRSLLSLARKSLASHYSGDLNLIIKEFEKTELPKHPSLKEQRPCFVSLHTAGRHLRGCIGILETGDPLYENVAHYVLQAALGDPRFPQVKENEIADIKIGISVLGPQKRLESLSQIEIGRHGLAVESGKKRGVLLAKVATEQKWRPEEFLRQTCVKAGLEPSLESRYDKFFFEEISFEEK